VTESVITDIVSDSVDVSEGTIWTVPLVTSIDETIDSKVDSVETDSIEVDEAVVVSVVRTSVVTTVSVMVGVTESVITDIVSDSVDVSEGTIWIVPLVTSIDEAIDSEVDSVETNLMEVDKAVVVSVVRTSVVTTVSVMVGVTDIGSVVETGLIELDEAKILSVVETSVVTTVPVVVGVTESVIRDIVSDLIGKVVTIALVLTVCVNNLVTEFSLKVLVDDTETIVSVGQVNFVMVTLLAVANDVLID
jgi:hypothetical protein